MSKYNTLLNILDKIIQDCPAGKYQKKYSVETEADLVKSRSRAYIHLFFMAKFGLLDFEERERYICDDSYDGGIDAYYIDHEEHDIYFLQSKFRANENNFESKLIDFNELLCMDVDRVRKGETADLKGNAYNGKVKQLQREIAELKSPGKYEPRVIVLANTECNKEDLRRLTGGFDSEVFDYKRSYNELVFPVVSGNYYSGDELVVNINLKNSEHPRIKYSVELEGEVANITVLFAPTIEIAKALEKYKNSILKYNPRSYLDLKTNKVNKAILDTLENKSNNEFALYNNGITIVAGSCDFSDSTGQKNAAKLTLNRPQIINGGQTAYTLSKAYGKYRHDKDKLRQVFSAKEVLIKIISFSGVDYDPFDEVDLKENTYEYTLNQLDIIEKVSQATNMQSPIDEADRRANDKDHVDFQIYAYEQFDMYYERKRGEFGDGLSRKFIERGLLIKREDLVRCCLASDLKPGEARRANKSYLFNDTIYGGYLSDKGSYAKFLIAYKLYEFLKKTQSAEKTKDDPSVIFKYGSALRYGKYAVISACFINVDDLTKDNFDSICLKILSNWIDFEIHVKKKDVNKNFFTKGGVVESNMLNYYKSSSVNADLIEYFNS